MSDDVLFKNEENYYTKFRMETVEVDGVRGYRHNHIYSQNIFDLKEDFYLCPTIIDEDGLEWASDNGFNINWESPYVPMPYKYGEVREDLWLEHGTVVGDREAY